MACHWRLLGSFVLIKDFLIQVAWTAWLHSHWNLDVLLNTMANNSFGLMALVTALELRIVCQNRMELTARQQV